MKFNLKSDEIDYVKILYKDNYGFSRIAKAFIKNISEYDIYACIKKDDFEKIPSPQEISAGFACKDGLYKSKTTLKYTKYEEPYLYFSIQTPDEVDYQQNREYFRVNIDKEVTIYYETEDGEAVINCTTYDISANGVRVMLEKETKFPQEVFVEIKLDKKTVRTKAKYVRTEIEEGQIKAAFIFSAFSFLNLEQADLDYISRVCLQKQIADKRNSMDSL